MVRSTIVIALMYSVTALWQQRYMYKFSDIIISVQQLQLLKINFYQVCLQLMMKLRVVAIEMETVSMVHHIAVLWLID